MYTFRLPQDFLIGTAHSAFQSKVPGTVTANP